MAIGDGLRRAVRSAVARLQGFQAGAPTVPGFGMPTPRYPIVNGQTEQRLERARPDVMRGRVAVNAGPYSDRVSTYPGSNLDPTKIDRILKSADFGVAIYEYADLMKQMRERDAHLVGIDRQRRQGVANKPFLMWPTSDIDAVAVGMSHAMRSMVDGIDGFPSATYAALSKNCDGWSMNEIVWAPGKLRFQIPDGFGGGPMVSVLGVWPRSIYWVHAKHTMFTQGSGDEPLLDLGPDGPVHLPYGKFVYTMTSGEGIASARGYSRACIWMHFFKHASFRDWNVFLHLYGIPFLQGQLGRGLWNDDKMKSVLEQALIAYGKGEQAPILMEGMKIDVHDPVSLGGAGDAHKTLFGTCNAEQSKAVLGEMLTIEPGESGSYKLGNVHQDSAHEVIVGDALTTASDYRRDLMLTAIEINADPLAKAFNCKPEDLPLALPRCGFRTDREWSPQQRIAIFRDATALGVEGSKSQLRNELQIDKPTSPDDVLRGEAVTIPKGGAAVGSTDASDGVKVADPAAEQKAKERADGAKKPNDDE